MTGSSDAASADKQEYDHAPLVSFQEVQNIAAIQPAIEWDKTFGGSGWEVIGSVISTPDGGYLLAGDSASPASGDKSENTKGGCDEDVNCDSDYWIVKIDAEGNKVWDKTLGGSSVEAFPRAILTPDGGYLLAGWSSSDASGDKSEDSKGSSDYWIVKLKDHTAPIVTSLTLMNTETDQKISDLTARQVKMYPVPTSGIINILHEGTGEEGHIVLLDSRGKMLLHQPMRQQPLEQVDLSGFKKGIYYLRVVSAEGVQVFRVAKE